MIQHLIYAQKTVFIKRQVQTESYSVLFPENVGSFSTGGGICLINQMFALKFMAVVFKGGPDTYDAANKAMYKEFVKKVVPDGEICFLVADPAVHGKGIGTMLLNELSRREKGRLIYLYTDDNCTYQFYEHKGFERSVEKEIEMKLHGKNVPLTCILYSKQL